MNEKWGFSKLFPTKERCALCQPKSEHTTHNLEAGQCNGLVRAIRGNLQRPQGQIIDV